MSKFRSSKGKINNRRKQLIKAKRKIEEEMEKKKREILNNIEGTNVKTTEDLDAEISRLAEESEEVESKADKLRNNFKKKRD